MLRGMPARTLSEWMAFDAVEPLNYERWALRRLEVLMAQMLALTSNVYRDRQKHPQPFSAQEFLAEDGAYRAPRPAKELWERVREFARAWGIPVRKSKI